MDKRDAWHILKDRIKRLTPFRLVKMGYLDLDTANRLYNHDLTKPIRFDYCKIETDEGPNGVFHVLCFGDYIPQAWLSDTWSDLTGASIVDIRAVKNGSNGTKKLASYCVSQYCSGQSEFVRFSWSWSWVKKGFVGVWKWLIKKCGYERGLTLWNRALSGTLITTLTKSVYLWDLLECEYRREMDQRSRFKLQRI
jgi:hypothetical protein